MRKKNMLELIRSKHLNTYTGRQKEIDLFFEELNKGSQYKVVSFSGIGGIGKTELRKELMRRVEKHTSAEFTYINFETKEYQHIENALVHMRNAIGSQYRIPFTLFDVAYILYMRKVNPSLSFNKKTIPFIAEGSWIADFISISEEIPYLSLVPKMIDIITSRSKGFFSQEDKEKIAAFEQMEVNDLLEMLPIIFAEELDKHISNSINVFVFFIDTYEALWTNQRMNAYEYFVDQWIRDLVAQLPNALWVIFGREKVGWEYYDKEWENRLVQVELGALSLSETRELLVKNDVNDVLIQDEIFLNSDGHPYSIRLGIDLFKEIKKDRIPVANDFIWEKTDIRLFQRFIKYLLSKEKETLELLALTNTWDLETFNALTKHFNIQMTIDDYIKLTRFSFISELEDGKWEMHQLMKKSLIDYQYPEKVIIGRSFLFKYFSSQITKDYIKVNPQSAIVLVDQAFFHGFLLMENKAISVCNFIDWFRELDREFFNIKKNHLTLPLLKQLERHLRLHADLEYKKYLGIILYDIGFIYMMESRDFVNTEIVLMESLRIREQFLPDDKLNIAKSYFGLATLYHQLGQLIEAEKLYLKSFELRKQHLNSSESLPLAFSSNGLGKLYQDLRKYKKAKKYYAISLKVYNDIHYPDNLNLSITIMNLISCYHELKEYDNAKNLTATLNDMLQKEIDLNQVIIARAKNVEAIVETSIGNFEKSMALFIDSYELFKMNLGEDSLELSKIMHNMALTFALLDKREEANNHILKSIAIKNEYISKNKLSSKNLNYVYTLEMRELLLKEKFAYEELKFNF
ncbi:tetratricopeptide repeat protein [Bacillus sp. m3-13]|uniref:tetratricopeptide repeat protein n=1 Tax=Bacillus sp. m3-13 TaxID=406124 RepID=UPI0001E89D42|nr:tetratricopeptide repeat protein [Bacillus sp. m3-13]